MICIDLDRNTKRLSDSEWSPSDIQSGFPEQAFLTQTPPGHHRFALYFKDGGEVTLDIYGNVPQWCHPVFNAVDQLLQLEKGWDSYDGSPIDHRRVVASLILALNLFHDHTPPPTVVPTSNGGLQFEWHTKGIDLEVEFVSANQILGIFEDHDTGAFWEEELTRDLSPLVKAISALSR